MSLPVKVPYVLILIEINSYSLVQPVYLKAMFTNCHSIRSRSGYIIVTNDSVTKCVHCKRMSV